MNKPPLDLTEAYYPPDAVYGEQLTPLLGVSPVFEVATEKQIIVRDLESDTSEESMNALLAIVEAEINVLDQMALEQGLMLKPVALSGLSIQLPGSRRLLETENATLVQTLREGPAVDDLRLSHEVRGEFYGFGTRFEAVPSGDTIGGIRPIIIYQIKVGTFNGPHANGNTFAIGDVGEARLEFYDDLFKQKITELLSILMDHDNPEVQRQINNLNIRLAKKQHAYDASDIRYVGYRANALMQLEQDTKYIDALTELISTYVDLDQVYKVAADAMLREPKDEHNIPTGSMTYTPGTPIVAFEGRITEIKALLDYTVKDETPRWSKKLTLYGVVYTPEAAYYLRLTDFENFK